MIRSGTDLAVCYSETLGFGFSYMELNSKDANSTSIFNEGLLAQNSGNLNTVKKTILVTGGAGFIGSAVIRYLLSKTDFTIVNIDKLTYAGNLNSLGITDTANNYHFERADICDENKVSLIFKKYKPDLVMHLAAESHVDRSISSPETFIKTNILGTYVLLNQSLRYFSNLSSTNKKSFLFHHISTDEVYGDLGINKDRLFDENSSYHPSSPYSASKASSDHLVRAWGHTYKLPVVISNCSNNYGPYHFPEKLIPRFIVNALLGRPLKIFGDGQQVRDWLYVDDHAEALFKVLTSGKVGETYNIGGHNEKTNITVATMICDFLDEMAADRRVGISSFRELITFSRDRPGHDTRYAIDASKIQQELDWIPIETFESGLRKTVRWYLKNEKWWSRTLPNLDQHT